MDYVGLLEVVALQELVNPVPNDPGRRHIVDAIKINMALSVPMRLPPIDTIFYTTGGPPDPGDTVGVIRAFLNRVPMGDGSTRPVMVVTHWERLPAGFCWSLSPWSLYPKEIAQWIKHYICWTLLTLLALSSAGYVTSYEKSLAGTMSSSLVSIPPLSTVSDMQPDSALQVYENVWLLHWPGL
ncbi:hypothetical protein Pelo_12984 [Pelomyxa schiedti]|nr:hypothetical protein Pelo_12984 [Pelomyxa schiedti]